MDVESAPKPAKPPAPPRRSHRCRNVCIALVAVLALIVVLIVILAFTVFKAKRAETKVSSAKFKNLRVSLKGAPVGFDLNVTLDIEVSVKNPNKVGFKYENSTCLLNYRGEQVGEVPIPAGEIGADQTKQMNLTLTVMADRFLSKSQAYLDYLSRVLPISTYTNMSGKVTFMGLFKVHVVSTSSCDLNLFLSNNTVGIQHCSSDTKL
ncbi:uncharacterized protein LOC104425141 [Eucalyptus grandis]|uniref:Uncharacterized protein n=2 Tax=Eucalyptus grandis TaxID=71139 RepID=A0ACC3ITJ9_EUCGR|nr:uncharacterized protein LOC104425141 [Eucalyptus grandis]KAK3405052.1 hypothetical protein EUGRSUZ_K01311 [Eucalyptus grandis]